MTIWRTDQTIYLEGVCPVEDAEVLIQRLQEGATAIDWSGCSHLHAACLQVLLVARLPMCGSPGNPDLARWLAPILAAAVAEQDDFTQLEPVLELES